MSKEFYRQKFPHILPKGRTFFITTRLFDSIPKSKLEDFKLQYDLSYNLIANDSNLSPSEKENKIYELRTRYFVSLEILLEKIHNGPHYLKNPEIAKIVMEQIHKNDGIFYDLRSYCIMSNHMHLVLRTMEEEKFEEQKFLFHKYPNVDTIMQKVKGASARYANLLLERTGLHFWEKESYDILIRNEKMYWNIMNYVLDNPVKAGLVKSREDYPFLFKKEIDDYFY